MASIGRAPKCTTTVIPAIKISDSFARVTPLPVRHYSRFIGQLEARDSRMSAADFTVLVSSLTTTAPPTPIGLGLLWSRLQYNGAV